MSVIESNNSSKSMGHPYGMKMYAELIGNYKKYRIKSLYDNIMAALHSVL